MADLPDWLSGATLSAILANAGGAGSRTAAQLQPGVLEQHVVEAWGEVAGSLTGYALPDDATTAAEVAPLLLTIVYGIAGYTATLEFYGSQPLEDRDPVVLRYQRAQGLLKRLVSGDLVLAGVEGTADTPAGGEAAIYDAVPDVNLAGGYIADSAGVGSRYSEPGRMGGSGWMW